MRVVFTREAADDLAGALAYIAAHNPAAAASVAGRVDRTISIIGDFPRAGRLDAKTGAREWVVPGLPLLIVYAVGDEVVELLPFFIPPATPLLSAVRENR